VTQNLAVFDFDHTLVTRDSFWTYLFYASGKARTAAALVEGVARFGLLRAKGDAPQDTKTFLKAHLLDRLLAGKKLDALRQAAVKTRLAQKENTPILRALHEHRNRGDVVVIASGGLGLYLPEVLRDIPYDVLICTDIGVENGIVTGAMINGNCVRQRKAERIAEWLAQNGSFGETFGYGNYPDDVPMMNLLKHRIIVS
jgi:HAD superfamily hydrolase (TIGR01490 family)